MRKTISRWSNHAGKINLTASQFAQCLALNEIPSITIPISFFLMVIDVHSYGDKYGTFFWGIVKYVI